MNTTEIGKFIKKLREEKGWTQEELAEKIPIGRNAISKWERGKTIPDISTLFRLRDIFNVSIDELLLGEKLIKKKITLKLNKNGNNNIVKLKRCALAMILILTLFLGFCFNQEKSVKFYTIKENEKQEMAYEFLSEITNNESLKKDLYNKLIEQEEKYGSKIEAWKLLK